MTTNCSDEMIITEPALNLCDYTTLPDGITKPIPNNANTVTQRGITEPPHSNRSTCMVNETTVHIGNIKYTATINGITEPTLNDGLTGINHL